MKQVRCVETGQVYDSATKAAQAHGVTPGMIGHVLKGRQATAAGYTWEYTHERSAKQKRYKGVYRDRMGRVYHSLRGFAQRHGYTIRQVQAAITDDTVCRTISLPLREDCDLFAPIHKETDNMIHIRYTDGTYYINDKPAGNFPLHPGITDALAEARETGKTVSLMPMQGGPSRLNEDEYWAIVTPAVELYRKRGERLTREQHEARRIIRDTWITAHPPTMPEFEGTPDRWRPTGVDDI